MPRRRRILLIYKFIDALLIGCIIRDELPDGDECFISTVKPDASGVAAFDGRWIDEEYRRFDLSFRASGA